MEYNASDSSGTDDDLPPSHQNRYARNAHVGNGRSAVPRSVPYTRVPNDMESQIHLIEQEAYCSVLRAFKAQSDAITWEKESLITELRKELRVSDDEHRELLSRVNNDDMIRRIREWRKGNGLQPGPLCPSKPVHESMPSPTVSVSRKKQKTSQSVASLPLAAPSPALHPSMQPSSSSLKQGLAQGGRTKKTKSISPGEIRWEGQDPGFTQGVDRIGQGRGSKKSSVRSVAGVAPSGGRGRGTLKSQPKKGLPLPPNGIRSKGSGSIELLDTDTLIKEVEKVFRANNPDPTEVEKAKKVLKDHEQSLVEAIAKLQEGSDGEDEGGHTHPFSQGQPMDRDQAWRKRMYDQMNRDGRLIEAPEGDKGRLLSEKQQEA